jgi:FlaA1/EpsC-like NDP-sugar epimerase
MNKASLEETFRGKNILITGGTGSIGSALTKNFCSINRQ